MATLYAFKFNNYYNRRLKRFTALEDYPEPEYFETGTYCNFNPNDGINTEIILGRPGNNNYEGDCDYFIYSDDNVNITSRWFVIEQTRKMGYQYKVLLHRDVIADNLDKILSSECFIEKAILPNNNPLIYNAENILVNQIFTSQTLLKDQTKCGWYVGYYTKNAESLSGTIKTNDIAAETYEILLTPIANWEYAAFDSSTPFIGDLTSAKYNTLSCEQMDTPAGGHYYEKLSYEYDVINNDFGCWGRGVGRTALEGGGGYLGSYQNAYNTYGISTINALLKGNYYNYHNVSETAAFLDYNNKIILDSTGKYYKISITPTSNDSQDLNITSSSGAMFNTMTDLAHNAGMTGTPDDDSFTIHVEAPRYILSYIEQQNLETTYDIPNNLKLITGDQPYNIFAIPYGEITVKYTEGGVSHTLTTTQEIADNTISAILDQQADKVYDAQLIGYCPVQFLITDDEELTITDNLQASFIEYNDTKVGVIFNVPSSRFSLNIPIEIPEFNYKMSVVCDKYRLTAPDQSSYFEIDAAKNKGLHTINIDVDLRPFNCYIHANPDFNGLYGQDFNTGRGLIYGNNLSLSRALNKFTEYQIQNSQFQNIFDRQVQNMEVSHEWEMRQSYVAAAAGTVSGAVSGAIGGGAFGPVGAVAGGLIGGAAAGAGGILDINMKEALYSEALDYKRDMFGFNLRNIQMQPNTLTRITAINQNNTIFIALDFYTCTDEEKAAVAKKIAWNSMTVGIIGQIQEYISNSWSYGDIHDKGYIKARLIRFEDAEEDFHNVNAIADELFKGVYFK